MLQVMGVVFFGLVVFYLQGSGLYKQKRKKEMLVFTGSLLLALALCSGMMLHLPIPSPIQMIGNLFGPMVSFIGA